MEIEVELLYFKNDVRKNKGIDLNKDKINELCSKFGAQVKMKDKTPGNMPQLSVSIRGVEESTLKNCIKEILTLYGKPDLPGGFLLGAEKKKGNELVKLIINEMSL